METWKEHNERTKGCAKELIDTLIPRGMQGIVL